MLLGIDFGSGGVKATLISLAGRIITTHFEEYPTYYPFLSWSEQDPADWLKALSSVMKSLEIAVPGLSSSLSAIAVDAPTHTAVLCDRAVVPLQNAIFWTDQRSSAEAAELESQSGDRVAELTLHRPGPVWTLPQLLWVKRHQPDIWQKIGYVLFAKDYVRYQLTGLIATDYIEAIGSELYDVHRRAWSPELCDLIGLPIAVLPTIMAPTDSAGGLTVAAAGWLGLRQGTPVIIGTTDTALEVYGSGAIHVGQATAKLATAGRLCAITDKTVANPFLFTYEHIIPGLWYPGTGTRSCASSYRWYRDVFGETEVALAKKGNVSPYALLDEAAAGIPAGSEGLFFHPYLLGELSPYNDTDLRASFTGATMKHTRAHFTRSVLEGVAFSLRDSMRILDEAGFHIEEFRVIGGGSGSPLWCQILADILGKRLVKPLNADSSFASAILAGVSIGAFNSHESAIEQCVKIENVIEPDMAKFEKYEKLFSVYREIHDGLAAAYRHLAVI